MKKIKLKKKRKFDRFKLLIISIFLIIICTMLIINNIGTKVSDKLIIFAAAEVSKISKLIVNKAVTQSVINQMDINNLFIIEKNADNEIQLIDFDTEIVNKILSVIEDNIIKYFEELENGYSSIIDIKNNLITNTDMSSRKEGIIFEIPIGVISDNPLLANIGPKIPVRLSFNGELETALETEVKNYGINNAVITVSVNIEVSEQVLMPVSSKKISISNNIPIAIKVIQGKIPNYYLNGIDMNSNLLTIPFNS